MYYYIQYHLHLQLLSATEYARQHGVVLKGDIPIGISRNSVEAWTEPHYFNLNGQAGAPPDDFSINGQNWGFPTYNWDVMEKDGYRWWMKRFQKMAEYFDAYPEKCQNTKWQRKSQSNSFLPLSENGNATVASETTKNK